MMATTLKAMKRVQEIRQRRERVFYKNRMKGKRDHERQQNIKTIKKNVELISGPSLKAKELLQKIQQKETKTEMDLS